MRDDSSADDKMSPNEGAEYLEKMIRELSRVAAAAELPFLAYILGMAAEEASSSHMKAAFKPHRATGSDLSQDKP